MKIIVEIYQRYKLKKILLHGNFAIDSNVLHIKLR